MTKAIRIENADMSDYKLVVQVWEKCLDIGYGIVEPDVLVSESSLDIPTSMVEVHVHQSRYVIVKEKSDGCYV